MARPDLLESRALLLRRNFDTDGKRTLCPPRPFMIELFGVPKSGKSTVKEMLKHFFKRNGWLISAPVEGAEFVELPRDEPQYNFQTAEYAMTRARELSYNNRFHMAIFDRAIYDGVVRMEYYRDKGVITPEEQTAIEGYLLNRWNRALFDLHVCLVVDPEIAIQRELTRAITKKDGDTMNPKSLKALLSAHERVWERLGCADSPAMYWHDSSGEDPGQTAGIILEKVLDAFSLRMARLATAAATR